MDFDSRYLNVIHLLSTTKLLYDSFFYIVLVVDLYQYIECASVEGLEVR